MVEVLAGKGHSLPKWSFWHSVLILVLCANVFSVVARTAAPVSPEMAEFKKRLAEQEKRGFASVNQFLLNAVADSKLKLQVRKQAVYELGNLALRQSEAHVNAAVGRWSRLAETLGQTRQGRAISSRLYREIWRLRLELLETHEQKRDLLLRIVGGLGEETPLSSRDWAANLLCDAGVQETDAALDEFLTEYGSAADIAFCRLRRNLIREAGSLVGGYEAALGRPNSPHGRLHNWAIRGLEEDASERAQEVLIEFARRLQDVDWTAALNAQHSLRQLGWSDEDLHAVGVHTIPPWIRNGPHSPQAENGTDTPPESVP